jgi:hypothetical protein
MPLGSRDFCLEEMGNFPQFSTVSKEFVLLHNALQPALHYAISKVINISVCHIDLARKEGVAGKRARRSDTPLGSK